MNTAKQLAPMGAGIIALGMLFYLVVVGEAAPDVIQPVLVGLLSGLGVDSVHRAKDKANKGANK